MVEYIGALIFTSCKMKLKVRDWVAFGKQRKGGFLSSPKDEEGSDNICLLFEMVVLDFFD